MGWLKEAFKALASAFGFFASENRGKKMDMKVTEHAEQERLRQLNNAILETERERQLLEARKQLQIAEIKFHTFNLVAVGEDDEKKIAEAQEKVERLEDMYVEQGGKLNLKERRELRKKQRERRSEKKADKRGEKGS